ncbi:DotI/IcmL family type IV secretion protein [Legionella shakespearei]|uniref:IcmL-like protein n=1 Tax=Legionella shakespearei DSM 23087 TaxID=1122169 RepID=A0A0W0Z018_9GAMM|nr:DotI/IcmL family type IV secretion protein [Legionella shakespearei]KTD62473.1 IcmL-like protein [Legionella shakespearei DSM 23087]
MNKKIGFLSVVLLFLGSLGAHAEAPDRTQLAVWANEAIVATYTFDYKNYLQQQKEIAKYFTADGWMAYSKALNDSKLPEAVQKNAYEVTAVATQPPVITTLDPTHWQATMTILVVYKNPQYQQQQNLRVVLSFSPATSGQGVRGFAATSLQSKVINPPCVCQPEAATATTQEGGKQ